MPRSQNRRVPSSRVEPSTRVEPPSRAKPPSSRVPPSRRAKQSAPPLPSRINYSGTQLGDVSCNNIYISGADANAASPSRASPSTPSVSSPSPPPSEIGTAAHWKRVRSSRHGPRCSLATFGFPHELGTVEEKLFEYCCTLKEAKIKRSLLASLIVDPDGRKPRSLNALWEKITSYIPPPLEDSFPTYIQDLIKCINNPSESTDSTVTPLQRLKAACAETMNAFLEDDADVYSFIAHGALWQMYRTFRFRSIEEDLPHLGEKSFAVQFSFWDGFLETVDGLRINHGEVRAASYARRSQDVKKGEGKKGEERSDCTFSLPFGHDKMLDIGMAEYGRFCAAGTDSSKWETDSHKLFLSMRDMLCHIHRAVKGDPEVMRQVRVFGIVGSGIIYQFFFMTHLPNPSGENQGSDVCILERGPVCKVPVSIEKIDQLAEIMDVSLQLRAVAQKNQQAFQKVLLSKPKSATTDIAAMPPLSWSFKFKSP